MEEPKKNAVHITRVADFQQEVRSLREKVAGSFNNREMSLVVTKLQEAEHWMEAYKELLESK